MSLASGFVPRPPTGALPLDLTGDFRLWSPNCPKTSFNLLWYLFAILSSAFVTRSANVHIVIIVIVATHKLLIYAESSALSADQNAPRRPSIESVCVSAADG